MSENGNHSWRTCDTKIVAFLFYRGFTAERFWREGSRVFFEFADTSQRKEAVLRFLNKQAEVEPIGFLDNISRARDMVTVALKA